MKGAVGYMLKDWNKPERPSDEEIDTRLKIARENLTRNQIKVKEGKIPVFVIFEGWGAAGKGSLVGRIIKNMDPRFFNVESVKYSTDEEKRRPFLYKYFTRIPEQGEFVFLDGGWMRDIVGGKMSGELSDKEYRKRVDSTKRFEGNSVLMEIQAFLFVMFVLCQFVYNQVSRLYEVFVFNEGKSEFPARRIMGINVLIMIVFGLLLVFGMLIFYHGRYGNIFSMIGMALLAIIKWILKLLLMLRGDDDTVMDDYIEETTTSPEPVEDEMDVMVNNAAGNALMEVVAIFLIIGVIILIIVTIVRYASRFRKSLDNDKDEVEYINNDEEKEYKVKKSVKVKDTKDKANIRYRKLYKKYAKSKKVVTKSKLAGAKVDSHMMPEEITSKLITDDEAKARRITDDYEKARYSNGEVSEEDISFLKNFK